MAANQWDNEKELFISQFLTPEEDMVLPRQSLTALYYIVVGMKYIEKLNQSQVEQLIIYKERSVSLGSGHVKEYRTHLHLEPNTFNLVYEGIAQIESTNPAQQCKTTHFSASLQCLKCTSHLC